MNETEKQAVKKIMEMVQQKLLFDRNHLMGKRVVEIMRKRNKPRASSFSLILKALLKQSTQAINIYQNL